MNRSMPIKAPWRYGRTVHVQRSWAHVRTRRRAPAFSCRDSGRSLPTSARVEARLARRHLSMPPCGRRHAGRRSFESCSSLPSQLDRSIVHAIAGAYVGNIRPASGASSIDEHHRTTFLCNRRQETEGARKRRSSNDAIIDGNQALASRSTHHTCLPCPRVVDQHTAQILAAHSFNGRCRPACALRRVFACQLPPAGVVGSATSEECPSPEPRPDVYSIARFEFQHDIIQSSAPWI
jgi:hypothetical protein